MNKQIKARILSTGEDVIATLANNFQLTYQVQHADGSLEYLYEANLEFLDITNTVPIDWEQRRYELAKAAMQGILARKPASVLLDEGLKRCCIDVADEMIKQLKAKE